MLGGGLMQLIAYGAQDHYSTNYSKYGPSKRKKKKPGKHPSKYGKPDLSNIYSYQPDWEKLSQIPSYIWTKPETINLAIIENIRNRIIIRKIWEMQKQRSRRIIASFILKYYQTFKLRKYKPAKVSEYFILENDFNRILKILKNTK